MSLRKFRLETTLLSALGILYLLSANHTPFGAFADDFKWVLLSENFWNFSILSPWLAHAPPETSINWGMSILLMPVTGIFGRNIWALKIYATLLLYAGTVLFYLGTRSFFKPHLKYVYLLLLFGSEFYISNSGLVISEIGFVFLFGGVVYLLSQKKPPIVFLGILTGLSLLTRTPSLLIFLILMGLFLYRKDAKGAGIYAAISLFILLPFLWVSKSHSGEVSFYSKYWALLSQASLQEIIYGIFKKGYFYFKGLACLTFIYLPTFKLNFLIVKVAAILTVWFGFGSGLIHKDKKGALLFLKLYAVAYIALFLLWPYFDVRYVRPYYPVFIFLVALGWQKWEPPRQKWITHALLGLALISNLIPTGLLLKKSFQNLLTRRHILLNHRIR